jgi:O-antigen/teichoic acid export membrane protein
MVGSILASSLVTIGIFIWQTRDVWRGPGTPFEWGPWLARVTPLTLGFGAFQFMFSADPLFVQAFFDESQTGFYVADGTLARALVAFTGPVVAVMFPKIVRSVARAEKTDVMGLTLVITAVLGAIGAMGLTVCGPWLLNLIYNADFREAAAPLLPWFAWGMVPLAVANVLMNDLLARGRFEIAPWLVAVALGYGLALTVFHDTFLSVIKTLGGFNLLFLAVALFFSWKDRRAMQAATAAPAPVV